LKASTVISPTEPAVRRYRSGLFRKDQRRGSGSLREVAIGKIHALVLWRANSLDVRFAADSSLEEDGFELSVPR
jgi:hypothetical protein